jgi:hypothetical protein
MSNALFLESRNIYQSGWNNGITSVRYRYTFRASYTFRAHGRAEPFRVWLEPEYKKNPSFLHHSFITLR